MGGEGEGEGEVGLLDVYVYVYVLHGAGGKVASGDREVEEKSENAERETKKINKPPDRKSVV